ncbi:MAG: YicC family protein [Betaproteobacteria bacterium]|nr:YicC family protein [Betaproteobacteria bacterium]
MRQLEYDGASETVDEPATVATVYSMTGFSAATRDLPWGTLALELKSVNHRYLEIQFRTPEPLRLLESGLRDRISASLKRGKVDCRIEWRRAETNTPASSPNTLALEQLRAASTIVQEVFPDATPLSVGEILQWPGVLRQDADAEISLEADCQALADSVLQALTETRAREGAKLKDFLLKRVDDMTRLADTLSPLVPALITAFQERLSARLRDALGTYEEERVRQEVILLSARIDIEEEISRLKVHLHEVRHILESGGAIGKRLDFMMQELQREANTLGSKSVSTDVSRASMDMKVLIEQMREQIQNIE